jgi:hypothetical protein
MLAVPLAHPLRLRSAATWLASAIAAASTRKRRQLLLKLLNFLLDLLQLGIGATTAAAAAST